MKIDRKQIKIAISRLCYFRKCQKKNLNYELGSFSTLELIAITGYHAVFPAHSRIDETEAIKRLQYLLKHPEDYKEQTTEGFPKGYWNDVRDVTGSVWSD